MLSRRQLEVVKLLSTGMTAKQAAFEMGISVSTTEHHIAAAKDECNVRTTPHLVAEALRKGWIE